MGIPDSSFLDLIERVRSWIPWGASKYESKFSSRRKMCCECKNSFMEEFSCESCGRVLCGKCMQQVRQSVASSEVVKEHVLFCKFCVQELGAGEYNERSDHCPQTSSERVLNNDNIKLFQSHHLARFLESQRYGFSNSSAATSIGNSSPVSFRRSSSRSDEEDDEDLGKHFFSPSSEYCRDISDVDSSSISAFYSFKSIASSPLDSPSRMGSTPTRADSSIHREQEQSPVFHYDSPLHQETTAVLRRPGMETEDLETTDDGSDDLPVFPNQREKVHQPLDFENNGLIWFPPPPDDEDSEMNNIFYYDDEDDDAGEAGTKFSTSSFSTDVFPVKDKANEDYKEQFRSLVSQLWQGEGIYGGNENGEEGWLDIITSVAWQAANFVKPDTKRGGSMDPGHYIKVKCIASGTPSESTLIKGVVCTKNIKHKRMASQYRNPRLLLLGGALEYDRTPNRLASFDTLLQQEMDHFKKIVAKIEAYRPNVLLVEKSVSPYAQEYLLAREISLVLNVKKPLLERIARCTGAHIVPTADNLSATRLGHCEIFRLERVLEECAVSHKPNRKSTKTLMFFEGCPRRSGCTVLLRGASLEVLKKVKQVVQYAVFAAYHLSLETCFLADEGATLPDTALKPPLSSAERLMDAGGNVSANLNAALHLQIPAPLQESCECSNLRTSSFHPTSDAPPQIHQTTSIASDFLDESARERHDSCCVNAQSPDLLDSAAGQGCSGARNTDLVAQTCQQSQCKGCREVSVFPSQLELQETSAKEDKERANHRESREAHELARPDMMVGNVFSTEYFSTVDNQQSILVSFSSRCVLKGTVCERSQLLRIKYYTNFDKPLGRYLQEDLFNQTYYCRSCKESTDAHVRCYTHHLGNLTITVKRIPSMELPGERDGKIWMWHRCLKCAPIDGVPPATRRVIMSDAAWKLSFGKFLELSFSNHTTANRVASCGHSLQKDCLRYYGFGGMVAFFRYSPIDILSVLLPPSMLEFNSQLQHEWVKRETMELSRKMEVLYAEVFDVLHNIEQKGSSFGPKQSDESEFHNNIEDLKVLLKGERNGYEILLQPVDIDPSHYFETTPDILELNRLRRCLLVDSYIWDHRLYLLDSLLKTKSSFSKVDSHMLEAATYVKLKEWRDHSFFETGMLGRAYEESKKALTVSGNPKNHLLSEQKEEPNLPLLDPVLTEPAGDKPVESYHKNTESTSVDLYKRDVLNQEGNVPIDATLLENLPSPASTLSDKIDSAWTGTGHPPPNGHQAASFSLTNQKDSLSSVRLRSPVRVYSFDSAVRIQEKIRRKFSSLRSFHASGEYRSMVRDPIPDTLRSVSHTLPKENQKVNSIFSSIPSLISSSSQIAGEGFWFLLPETFSDNMVIPVYDNEPTSIITYVLGSDDYNNWITNRFDDREGGASDCNREDDHHLTSTFAAWKSLGSLGSLDSEGIIRSHGSDDASSTIGSRFLDPKKSHFKFSFENESSSNAGKVKFSVICYFAKQFDALRQICCPSEVDFLRSLSRCSRWNAQGGKSNVYFAKSFDERFIIKQVTKTELDSFEDFAPEYFKYLTDSLASGSPTCLAKVLGIYQVTVKHLKGGKESKMELMVMENLFFGKNISRVYDLKGSVRSRYNPDTTGKNKVLLDMNLLETLRTNPIFLSSKAKRTLERAVWNDTSFLASVDVMDYSLLVGVDEEQKELVLGIIDFMRQYTWDKHLETWVKASGILGGPKNASPTVVSPIEYKKRFRKAMSTYFSTVPDQWSQ